ncbi:DUF732 domain-containing protein [Streptomyces sp. NPDC050564]|uniref:DUF732 domain-containing protein n=1 Tax=Streptomyces sp. NPDC050564 TaxID=3365631 RepID=UPI00379BBB81
MSTLMGMRRNRTLWVGVVAALLVGGTACGGDNGTGDSKPTRSAASKPTKSYEERNADYVADLPSDLVDKAGQRQMTEIGYGICGKLKDGQSENSILNYLESQDPIWLGLYKSEVMDAAKAHLCDE